MRPQGQDPRGHLQDLRRQLELHELLRDVHGRHLADGGAGLKDVVKVTIYICNPHDVPKARSILQEYFGEDPPASTLCVLRGLANPNFLLEIEAIAAV